MGSLIFKSQPLFSKEDEKLLKKINMMRKRILYNVSNVAIEKFVDECQPFRLLLENFLQTQKYEILKTKTKDEEELNMY